jgi:hypothetical protein
MAKALGLAKILGATMGVRVSEPIFLFCLHHLRLSLTIN